MIAKWVLLQLREELEVKILKKTYLYDIIKREIWDSMTVKYKTIMVRRAEGGNLSLVHCVLMNKLLTLDHRPFKQTQG